MGMMAVQYPNRYFASLTILFVHTFSADYLEDVSQATRTRAEMHVMNYATKCVIKMKWEIFFLWKIKLNEPALQRS